MGNINRIVIVLVSADFTNAKEICQQKNNLNFETTQEIIESFSKDLVRDEDFIDDVSSIKTVSLNEFISMCDAQSISAVGLNEFISMYDAQTISIENYFICKVTKRIGKSSIEIFDEWLKQLDLDAEIFGDWDNANSIIIELSDDVVYQIGYYEEGDSFYFNNISDVNIKYIDNSEDFEMLYVWEKQLKQIIVNLKK